MHPIRLLLFALFMLSTRSALLADMPVVFPDIEQFAEVGNNFMIQSSIPGEFETPDAVVAAMFLLGDQVKNPKLTAPFTPASIKGSSHFEGALPLGSYFRGARIEKRKTFVIAFSGEAMRYLNNTSAIQQIVKGALEETIRINFPKIKTIVYEIDGKIVEEWDA